MLKQKVYDFIKKYNLIEDGDKIVLGVSGGPDSICMLDILYKLSNENLIDFKLYVAHINHGLRENANIDEMFVQNFCNDINIKCFIKHADIKQEAEIQKKGLEETGRIIRYEFFNEIMKKVGANKIAIAHNNNDNAETMIMNLLRGTGTRGLIGIEKISGRYIRPLIDFKREEIEEYLKLNNIQSRHDESNDENIYTRNKIRNIVIPYIKKEFNPNIIDTMKRLSEIVREEENYLKMQTEITYNQICLHENNVTTDYNKKSKAEIIIDLKKFNCLDKVMQKRIVFLAINKLFGTVNGIEKIHIDDIIKLCNKNIGNKYLTPNKNLKIVTQKKQLIIIANP